MVTTRDIGIVPGKPWVIIPSCGESRHLERLVRTIAKDGVSVCVVINNMANDREEIRMMNRIVPAGGYCFIWPTEANIYEVWNWGIRLAQDQGASSLAILNDDIDIEPGSVGRMDSALNNSDFSVLGWDYNATKVIPQDRLRSVRGSFRKGGVGGFAFILKPEEVTLIDERFTWWGGDDDLFMGTMARGGKLGIRQGEPVVHHTSTSASKRPEVYDQVHLDRELLLEKWGETW